MGSAQQVNNKIQEIDMAKQKERSEIEHLRSTIKTQRSQIKNLKKEVERARKRSFQTEDLEERLAESMIEEEYEENEIVSVTAKCPKCGNKVESVELGSRVGVFCDCGYRKSKPI